MSRNTKSGKLYPTETKIGLKLCIFEFNLCNSNRDRVHEFLEALALRRSSLDNSSPVSSTI